MNWGELVAGICASTGWTWDYVLEHMDFPRLEALREQWRQFPPLNVLVAHYLGAAKPAATAADAVAPDEQTFLPSTRLTDAEFDELLAARGLPTFKGTNDGK